MPLSVRVLAGRPCSAVVAMKVVATIVAVMRWWALMCRAAREWSSSQVMISVSVPVLRR